MSVAPAPPSHFSPDALLNDLFGNRAALDSVLQTVPKWLIDMRSHLNAAATADDSRTLARHAHTLRGALTQLRAERAVELTRALETICRDAPGVPPDATGPALLALLDELDALHAEIDAFLTRPQA